MVEMQSACFCSSGSTLKFCFSTLTPPGEPSVLNPSLLIQLRNGYSLPENHTPSVRPLRSAGVLTPVSARQVISIPECLNGCDVDHRHALLARGECPRHPVDDNVGATAGQHLLGGNVGAARLDRHVESLFFVEALVL